MRRTVIAVTAVAALFALAGCSDDGDEPKADTSTTAPAKAADVPTVPKPNAEQTATLMTALKGIKPELAADEERAVGRARNVCADVKKDTDEATLAANANARFSGGTAGELTDAQGAEIVKAVKASFCA